jgi:hypothetical protein
VVSVYILISIGGNGLFERLALFSTVRPFRPLFARISEGRVASAASEESLPLPFHSILSSPIDNPPTTCLDLIDHKRSNPAAHCSLSQPCTSSARP